MISCTSLLFNNLFSKNKAQNEYARYLTSVGVPPKAYSNFCSYLFLHLTFRISFAAQNTNLSVRYNPMSNTFTLTQSANASAGVYTTNNVLVRTLWSLVPYQAGTYSITWDGKDDLGNQMPIGNYIVKVVSNNINYQWEGIIGNNSTSDTGATTHRYYGTIACMTEVGNYMYYGNDLQRSVQMMAIAGKYLESSAACKKIRLFPNGTTSQQPLFNCANANNVFCGRAVIIGTAGELCNSYGG